MEWLLQQLDKYTRSEKHWSNSYYDIPVAENCVFPISQCTVSHECISPCLQLDLAYRYRYRISFYNIYIWNIIDYPIKIVYPQVTTKPCVQLRSRRPAVPKYPRPSLCSNKKLLRIPLLCRLFKTPQGSQDFQTSHAPFPLQVPDFFFSTVHWYIPFRPKNSHHYQGTVQSLRSCPRRTPRLPGSFGRKLPGTKFKWYAREQMCTKSQSREGIRYTLHRNIIRRNLHQVDSWNINEKRVFVHCPRVFLQNDTAGW